MTHGGSENGTATLDILFLNFERRLNKIYIFRVKNEFIQRVYNEV